MANARVFVDDAVLGRLPPVCVIDGVSTDDRLTFSQRVNGGGGLGVAWLLVLAGPLGWLGLVLIALFRQGGESLTVTVPHSEAAHLRRVRGERARLKAMLIMTATTVEALVALIQRTTDYRLLALGLGAAAAGALVHVVVEWIKLGRLTIHLGLDASRRWVTLIGVHPEFLAALQCRDSDSSLTSSL